MKQLLIVLGVIAVCSAFAPRTTALPLRGTDEMVASYLQLKEHLVVSDSVSAALQAKTLGTELGKLRIRQATFNLLDSLQIARREAIALANDIAATQNINKQRQFFSQLSEKVWYWMAHQPQPSQFVYRQQCPMTGQTWLSHETAIKNPYYPKNMLTCGHVTDSLGK